MKIGYCLWGMPKVPVEESLPRLAAIGYQGVELTVCPGWSAALDTLTPERRQLIRTLLQDNNLSLTAVAGHRDILSGDAETIARNMQFLKECIDLAVELTRPGEQPIMVSLVGGKPEQWDEVRGVLAERIAELGEHAARCGAIYATELHTGTAMDVPEKVLWILNEVQMPSVRMNFDISHPEVMGIPIEVSVPALAPHSVHTHVKDQTGIYPNHVFLTPGEGPFDYVRYMRAMQTAGYKGFIMAEVSVMRQRKPDYEPFVHAAFAHRVLDYAFQAAGVVREA